MSPSKLGPFLSGLLAVLIGASVTAQTDGYPPQKELNAMLKITWTEGPEYPMGIQESACAVLDGKFVSAGGFTRHPKDVVKLHPDAFDGKPNGFTKLTLLFDPLRPEAGWARIADIPGPPRQGAAAAVVGDALYAVGGFNYTEPLAYRATYQLRREAGQWLWTKLECDLPWPVCEASAAVIGTKIYLVGAADYFKTPGAKNADFHSESGRDNSEGGPLAPQGAVGSPRSAGAPLRSPVGRALLVLDTEDLKAGWRRLADLPGTPRFDCACAAANPPGAGSLRVPPLAELKAPQGGAAGGRLYVLGGIYAPTKKTGPDAYYNVVDSWAYDPAADHWSRSLPDMPHGANRRAVTFKDRYVILLSGYRYPRTWRLDGTQQEVYSAEESRRSWKSFFEKTVLVYDTATSRLVAADPLLDQTSWPGAAIHGGTIFCLGGEGGARLWHPATFQIGKIEGLSP